MSAAGTRPPLFDPDREFDRLGPEGGGRPPRFPARRTTSRRRSPLRVVLVVLLLVAVVVLVAAAVTGRDDGGTAAGPEPDVPVTAPAAPDDAAAQDPAPPAAEGQPGESAADEAAADAAADDAAPGGDDPAVPAEPVDLQAASAFAAQFAHDYLNWDEGRPEVRARTLASYLAPGLDPQLGWDGSGVQVAVLTLPVAVRPTASGVEVTVAVEVTGVQAPRWVHLAVPLAADDEGRWAVTAPPAFVPRPAAGSPDTPPDAPVDVDLTAALADHLETLLTAYATSDVVTVEGVTAPDAAIPGLRGQLALAEVAAFEVRREADGPVGHATVVWHDEVTGATLTQAYRLPLVQVADGWRVGAVQAGG